MTDWKPIDDDAKDGTVVLLTGYSMEFTALWTLGKVYGRTATAEYVDGAWLAVGCSQNQWAYIGFEPTHYQVLPELPKEPKP